MSQTMQTVFDAAMTLPASDREVLAYKLIETLNPSNGNEQADEEEFLAELLRRRQECLDGIDRGVSMGEVRSAILKELDGDSNS
jgi:hypothetical protein